MAGFLCWKCCCSHLGFACFCRLLLCSSELCSHSTNAQLYWPSPSFSRHCSSAFGVSPWGPTLQQKLSWAHYLDSYLQECQLLTCRCSHLYYCVLHSYAVALCHRSAYSAISHRLYFWSFNDVPYWPCSSSFDICHVELIPICQQVSLTY